MAENTRQTGEEVMKEILIGVTENCVSESNSKTPEKVRNTLVNSIAANIFDTLKCNDDIAQILVGVLDPSRTDKDALMKNLMSKVNSTLQDSLLRNARGSSLNSDCLTPENSDSMRSSTISSSSVTSGQNSGQEKNPRQYDGFETAESDFVYESSCSMETKKYEMGKHVEKHEVPLTVHELSKSISVPICVEDWVASNSDKMPNKNDSESSRNEQSGAISSRSEQTSRYVTSKSSTSMCRAENTQSIPVKITSTPKKTPPKIVTSLPPLPRSQSATMFQDRTAERIQESKSTQFTRNNEMSEVSVMEPLEVKTKAAPKKQHQHFPQNPNEEMQATNVTHHQINENISQMQEEKANKDERQTFNPISPTSNNKFTAHPEETVTTSRLESKKYPDSLLIQVQGENSSRDNYKENISQFTCQSSHSYQTFQKNDIIEDTMKVPPPTIVVAKEDDNEGHYIQDCTTANYESADFRQEQRSDSRQSQRSLSPLSVGPIPSPIDPVQEEKAQETFDKLYEKMKNNGEVASDEMKQSARHSSETISLETRTETKLQETESRVHIVPISFVDKVDNIKEFIDGEKVKKDQEKILADTKSRKHSEENPRTNIEIKIKLEENVTKKEPILIDKTEATSSKTTNIWRESNATQKFIPEIKLPPLEDPSFILLSPTPIKRSSASVGSAQLNTRDEILATEADYVELESLAEDVKNIKEDKAAAYLHDKLRDNIGDMLAYEKHNTKDDKDAQGKPINHFGELKQKQEEAQKEFHKKLFNELQKEVGETRNSAVADALGTKFEIKVQPKQQKNSKLSHSMSTNQIYETNEQQQGSLSVPSKSPEQSRRGSFSNTYMSKGAFWSNSLPRAKRRVTFVDEAPQRPPPPAPVRQQSIHTMKDFTNVSQIYNQTLEDRKHQILNPQAKINECEARTETPQSSAKTSLNNLQSVEYRSYSKTRNMASSEKEDEYKEDEFKVDMGERKDPWVELYGKPVLNNTLHDRIEQHQLQKSQSAVWNRASSMNEIMEHAPVTSTDKLEKPKKVNPPPLIDISPCEPSINTLPRRSSHSMMAGSQQTNLRRNASLSDLSRQNTFNTQYTNSDQRSPRQANEPQNETLFQVPPNIVRGIVKTVLQNQGITNPSEEILNKAIQEYYSKNPQGVSVNSSQGTPTLQTQTTNGQNKVVTESEGYGEDFKRNVDNQPYRTSPLVTPAPRTITESGSGSRSYQQFRGPQFNPTPRQQSKNVPIYMRGASSMSNLNTQESFKLSDQSSPQTSSTSAHTSPQTPVRMNGKPFLRQPDSFSNYKNIGSNSSGTYVMTKNNSINQSKSFKKVMADVLRPGETEF